MNEKASDDRFNAILLVGPTGSGKTPLGELLEQRGIPTSLVGLGETTQRLPATHFDFGAALREAVTRGTPDACLSHNDIAFLRQVLETGALLEDEQFDIARRLLLSHLASHAAKNVSRICWRYRRRPARAAVKRSPRKADSYLLTSTKTDAVVVMNGLPRHVGQAAAAAAFIDVRAVVQLECDATTVLARLANDIGGDRAIRDDDHDALVRRKLATYEERTLPLVLHYKRQGTRVAHVPVSPTMTPEDAYVALLEL